MTVMTANRNELGIRFFICSPRNRASFRKDAIIIFLVAKLQFWTPMSYVQYIQCFIEDERHCPPSEICSPVLADVRSRAGRNAARCRVRNGDRSPARADLRPVLEIPRC